MSSLATHAKDTYRSPTTADLHNPHQERGFIVLESKEHVPSAWLGSLLSATGGTQRPSVKRIGIYSPSLRLHLSLESGGLLMEYMGLGPRIHILRRTEDTAVTQWGPHWPGDPHRLERSQPRT
ncbi:unnamed protein product [Cuscuta europaea]|uniref:Uncharacterized protein n=1 Tax=Cuscuta europaea TaxID=41803 RepID=A0A9P0Z025_CUSEU|nr:unnamed protein product [Cuscuta europaea]